MRRRGIGLKNIERNRKTKEQYNEKGQELLSNKIEFVQQQLNEFKIQLEKFAVKHKDSIRKDAVFRTKFQQMCNTIGVDPLLSKKGFWASLLDFGDFYYTLAVQIIEVGIQTRDKNGGLLSMEELFVQLKGKRTSGKIDITEDDVHRAVEKLNVLGNGFHVIQLEGASMIVTVPKELSSDQLEIVKLAKKNNGVVDRSDFKHWEKERVERGFQSVLKDEMAWIDHVDGKYYFQSICLGGED